MRFTVKTKKEKYAELRIPHRWFAWFPVRTGPHSVVWLERVWRRLEQVVPGRGVDLRFYSYTRQAK
jgi:hypothetical protein